MFCVCARALDDRINSGKERTIVAPRPVVVYLLRSHTRTHARTYTLAHTYTLVYTLFSAHGSLHTPVDPFYFISFFFSFSISVYCFYYYAEL